MIRQGADRLFAACGFLSALILTPAIGVKAKPVEFSLGAKGTIGGNLWSEPDGTPASEIGFTESRGGFGAGGGLYGEARFIRFLGLELDLLFEWDSIWEHQEWHWGKTTTKAEALFLRLPLLLKALLPVKIARLGLGIGPEFVVPLSSKAEWILPSGVSSSQDFFRVRTKTSTMLAFELGSTFSLGYGLVLPISIRAAYNLTQPSAWGDRVTLYYKGQEVKYPHIFDSFALLYQNSWDFRLTIGLGYDF